MPHSTYSKIYEILTILNDGNSKDIFEFSKEIHDGKFEPFAIWRREYGAQVSIKRYCSPESIRRIIRFINSLGLIEIDKNRICTLNEIGKNATNKDNYPFQLNAQIKKYMRETQGFTFEELERIIGSINSPNVADVTTIHERLLSEGKSISESQFRLLMYLLFRCGSFKSGIKKIYFIKRG